MRQPSIWMVSGNGYEVADGVAHYTQRLLQALVRARPQWRWFWLHRRPTRLGLPVRYSGGIWQIQPDHTWTARGRRLATLAVRAAHPSLLHVQEQIHSFHETRAACDLADAVRCPIAVTLHEFHTELASSRITSDLIRRAMFLAANDQRTADQSRLAAGRAVDEIWWSPSNVVPLPESLQNKPAKRPGLIVTFGQINPIKSFSNVAAALRSLKARHPELHWELVGPFDPASNPHHAKIASELKENWISLSGGFASVDDPSLRKKFLEAEAMILPFADGASPRRGSLQAAWAFGLPVVTTHPEVEEPSIVDGKNALLVRDDSREWESAIARVLEDPELRARLSLASLETARDFSWERLADRHIQRYEAMLRRL